MLGRVWWRSQRVVNTSLRSKLSTVPPNGGSAEARAARKARMEAMAANASSSSSNKTFGIGMLCLAVAVGAAGYAMNDIKSNPNGALATAFKGSVLESTLAAIYNSIWRQAEAVFEPSSDKLMPDWPTAPCYANVPPGTPCPPLLIVDLERTLVGSVHDYQHGWRHVRRPGVKNFLKALSQYYEIVIFSENDLGVAGEIIDAIDPEGMAHRLGMTAGEMRDSKVLKRLEYMNRDPKKILIIDDNPESVQLCKENAILIKPFTDVNSKTDRELENLIPLLQAFVHDNVEDFPRALRDLGTHDAEEAVAEYRMRVAAARQEAARKRNRGLGALIRGPASAASEDDGFETRSAVLSPAQIAGLTSEEIQYHTNLAKSQEGANNGQNYFNKDKPKPSDNKKTGKLMELWQKNEEQRKQAQAEHDKMMNEIYQQRMMAKHQQQASKAAVSQDMD